MADEQVLEQGSGSILVAFLSHPVLSMVTLFLYPVLAAKNSGVAVTEQRIIIKDGGLLGATTNEVRLDNVQGVRTEGILLGFLGNALTVSNAAGDAYRVNTNNPQDIRNAINRAQA